MILEAKYKAWNQGQDPPQSFNIMVEGKLCTVDFATMTATTSKTENPISIQIARSDKN